jgi:hypothetical protein
MTREQQIAYEAVFGMAEPSIVGGTVKALEARLEYLRGCQDHDHPAVEEYLPIWEKEIRILVATVAAIKAEFAPGYFGPDYIPKPQEHPAAT